MGKRIKSTGVILDASSMASAPVSPAGTVALRAKSDSTQFQYSANGGVWTDFTGGGGSTPRLDQVLDPDIPATDPPTNRVKTFSMTDHSLAFAFTATQSEECFVITSLEPVTPGAAGSILLIQARGATTEKNPLRIETRGVFAFTVASTGKVAIGAETAIDERLNIYQTNTGSDNSGLIFGGCTMTTGSTATSVRAVAFQLDDSQDTASLLSMKTLELELIRTGGVANTNVTATVLDFDINIGRTTKTVRGLTMGLSCVGTLTVTDWEGIRITAPSTVGSPTITNKRAIITESGAGNVGFGTLLPTVQLHVAGAMHEEQSTGQVFTIKKASDADETAQIDLKRAKVTGDVINGDVTGRIFFYGYRLGNYQQHAYIHSTYNTDYGAAGAIEIGAGSIAKARVMILQTDAAGGGVTLYGGAASPFFQVQLTGFQFSHGTTGSLYYRDYNNFFVATESPGAGDRIAFWDDDYDSGNGAVRWLTLGTNLSISDTTLNASGGGGGTPGGSSLELQYNNAGTFGGIPNAHVDVVGGSNIILPAYLQLRAGTSLDQEFFISATNTSSLPARFTMRTFRADALGPYIEFNRGRGTEAGKDTSTSILQDADTVGIITFRGYVDDNADTVPVLTQLGYLHCYWNTTLGGIVRLAARNANDAKLEITDNTPVTGTVSVTMLAGSHYVQVAGSGIRLSLGSFGAMYYQGDIAGLSFLTAIETSGASDGWVLTLNNASGALRPGWEAPPAGGTVTPPVTLTLSTGTDDNPTLIINHTQTSASALAFATKIWFNHAHAGSVSNGRRGLAVGWNQTVAGGSTNGDAILNVYGQNSASLSLGSYHLMGVLIDSAFSTAVPTFTALRIKEHNATIRRAITVDILAGDVVIGGNVPNGQLHGYLYIPTSSGTPTTDITTVLPSNTCAIIFDRTNNKLYANDAGATWIDLTASGGSPAGSGSELQYRNAGAFGAIGSSSVDANNMITLSGGIVGQLALQNDAQTVLYLRHASTSNYPGILFYRARGTWASKSAVQSGDNLGVLQFSGHFDSTTTSRVGAEVLLGATANWSTSSAPTVFRVKTTHINESTPRERMIIGGSKTMYTSADNTLVDLFSITFNAADQLAGGGELHIVFVAKQVSGTVATQVYRRKFSFIAGHNGATNTSMFHMKEDANAQTSAASTGSFTGISHAINADAAVAIATAIPATPNLIATNVITYKMLANSSLTTFSQFTMYYHIIYHGEINIVLL